MLTRTMSLIAAGASLPLILNAIVTSVEIDHPGVLCSILLLDESGQHLLHGAAPSLPHFYTAAIDGVAIGPCVGSCGTAAYTGKRVIVSDIQTDPLWAAFRELAGKAGLASCWSEPIKGSGGRLLGTFAMYHRDIRGAEPGDIRAILAAAHLAAIAIERKETEEALAASEARARRACAGEQASLQDLDTLFNVSQDLLSIVTLRGYTIKANQSWHTLLGYDSDRVMRSRFIDIVHPDDVPIMISANDRLRMGEPSVNFIVRCECADGTYKHVEWHAGQAGARLYCIGRDVTERMEAEAQMQAARAEAEAANRAKSDFLANMSHEVRTPLNGVIGVVGALAQTNLTPAQREMVELIQSSGATLERLVSDILDVSKIEAGRLELELREFDLQNALGSVLDVARIRADEKGLGFKVEWGGSARGLFRGDSVRIKQILDNLLSNAVKFTTQGEVGVRIEIEDVAASERIRLEVRDTGVGFAADGAADLFERFSQADSTITRRFGGTGLGLSIIKALLEMMGGSIEVSSTPGQGSVFSLNIPLPRTLALADYDADSARPAASTPDIDVSGHPDQDRPLRILLAEDNATNQKVVELILAPYGVDLTVVDNGEMALKAFEDATFDLVLMDMQMPVMDGLAATRALRAFERGQPQRQRTAVAMLSANAMEHHRDDAYQAGADLHIAKPVTAEGLILGVQEALSLNAHEPPRQASA
ncbi:MAG: ATP-binding protein [Caulobacteraceae bacterium]|nr:ATP-binding protein [Caulobacteraceae bacterium]